MNTQMGKRAEAEQIIDPVCGMVVDSVSDELSCKYEGRTCHFCSRHCLEKCKSAPEQHVQDKTDP